MSHLAAEGRKAFAYQAAKYSLYAPLVVIGLGICLTGVFNNNAEGPAAGVMQKYRMVLVVFNALLLLSSCAMGVVALAAIPRLGKRDLLISSIVGMALSLFLLSGMAYLLFSVPLTARVARRIQGEWNETAGPFAGHVHMRLGADGNGTWVMDKPVVATASGKWRVARPKDGSMPLLLVFQFEEAPATLQGIKGQIWEIEQVEDSRMDLSSKDAEGKKTMEIFARQGE